MINRREFLQGAGLLFFFKKFPFLERIFKDDYSIDGDFPEEKDRDYIDFLKSKEYLKKEDVPLYMQDYVSGFNSWLELVLDQKKKILEYISSEFYREQVLQNYKEYFQKEDPKKTQDQIQKITDDLIKDRLKNVLKTKIFFKNMDYYAGFYRNKKVFLNTDNIESHTGEEPGNEYELEGSEVFVPAHELVHSSQDKMLMIQSVLLMLDVYLKEGVISSEVFDFVKERNIKKFKNGRAEYNGNGIEYEYRPDELASFFIMIKMPLHIFSEQNPNLIRFNMYKDSLTLEHLDFLKNNIDKFFPNHKTYIFSENSEVQERVEQNRNTFSIYDRLSRDSFLMLINKAI